MTLRATLLIALFFFAGSATLTAHAADKGKKPSADGTVTIEGKVSTEKKDVDNIVWVKIKTDKGELLNVTLDDNGKQVAKQYDSIRVLVKGKIATKDGQKWLTVTQIGEGTKRKK